MAVKEQDKSTQNDKSLSLGVQSDGDTDGEGGSTTNGTAESESSGDFQDLKLFLKSDITTEQPGMELEGSL